MEYGYAGRVLIVDLSSRKQKIERLEPEIARNFLGGRGLGIRFLYNAGAIRCDPYGNENPLIFSTGPYTGTGVFSGFYNITTHSPLTGLAASSHSGGTWGPMLKKAGFDAVVILGKSSSPVYLLIKSGSCEIIEADAVWGKEVTQTQKTIQDRHGKMVVAAIGPGGENLVRYAAVMNDLHRAAGRGGAGAVMGSKKLKAIAVEGKQEIAIYDQNAFLNLSRAGAKKAMANGKAFAQYGTSIGLSFLNQIGMLPTRNFTRGCFPQAEKISAEAIHTQHRVRDKGCFRCPMKCANYTTVSNGAYRIRDTAGPEYETLVALGSNCGNADLSSIIKANNRCNDLGLDTMSAGNTIALLFHLVERKLVPVDVLPNLDYAWGNPNTILNLIELIAKRDGIGDILAEGSARMAERFGKEAEQLSVHAKGQEFPGFEIRRAQGTGLSFATSNRGACHLRSCFYVDELASTKFKPDTLGLEKVEMLIKKENLMAVVDSLVMCKFGQRYGEFDSYVITELLNSITGFKLSEGELIGIGERIYNLERMYNMAQGVVTDTIPQRFFEENLDDGLDGGKKISRQAFTEAVGQYYRERRWNTRGYPEKTKQKELGIYS